jgi:acyl carrier protein
MQVKIRGFRIELGEIESALLQHPEIRQAAVIPENCGNGENRLVAYMVRANGASPGDREIRAFLRQRLPAYMIPSALAWLDALPMNHNGKLDTKALPAVDLDATSDERLAPAETDVQKQLVEIWEDLLNRRPIGIRDSFFELGGHSLMAMRLFTRIAQKWNVDLSLQRIFDSPTVAELASTIESAPRSNGASNSTAAIPVAARKKR